MTNVFLYPFTASNVTFPSIPWNWFQQPWGC